MVLNKRAKKSRLFLTTKASLAGACHALSTILHKMEKPVLKKTLSLLNQPWPAILYKTKPSWSNPNLRDYRQSQEG